MGSTLLTNPNYYLYLANVFVFTATNLQATSSSSSLYNGRINYSVITRSDGESSILVNNRTFSQYKNMIQQKYRVNWFPSADGQIEILIKGNTKYTARHFSSSGFKTIEYFRNNERIGKFRFNE